MVKKTVQKRVKRIDTNPVNRKIAEAMAERIRTYEYEGRHSMWILTIREMAREMGISIQLNEALAKLARHRRYVATRTTKERFEIVAADANAASLAGIEEKSPGGSKETSCVARLKR